MQVLVLAAGKGTRLKPYTDSMNKCMIPIEGKPLLYHNLLQCMRSSDNITDIVIVVGYKKEDIISYFGYMFMGKPIKYVYQEKLNGIAGAVSLAASMISADSFLLVLGDMLLIESHLPQVVTAFHSLHPDGLCGVVKGKSLEEMRDNYTLHFDSTGKIDKIVDKPNVPFNDYMGTGYFLLSSKTLNYVNHTPVDSITKQRGVCEWLELCIQAGLTFYPSIVGKDAINLNNPNSLDMIQTRLNYGGQ